MMTVEVFDKTSVFGKLLHAVYPLDTIVSINHFTYGEMKRTGHYDLADYKRTEIFMAINFKNGEQAHFPCSKWDIEFHDV